MKTLLIDNYDSFTFNLFQLIAEINNVPPTVVRNDAASWSEIRELDYDNIVVSPGPGRPEIARDFGISANAILESDVPVLGICLGHQGLCHAFGGKVSFAETVMHGRPSQVFHTGADIFSGLPSPFSAIRYHSLHVSELPEELEKMAWTDDDITMGVRHKNRPIWGLQFHPESILTEYGRELLTNFLSLTVNHVKRFPPRRAHGGKVPVGELVSSPDTARKRADLRIATQSNASGEKDFRVLYRRFEKHVDAEHAYMDLYSDSTPSFWLDTAAERNFSRFSYMGDASGPHAEYVTYNLSSKTVKVETDGNSEVFRESIFDYLERTLEERQVLTEGLPFDFNCGYAGYLGYELKADVEGDNAHPSPNPDAAFVFADRLIAFDHEEDICYLVCIETEDNLSRAEAWLDETHNRLLSLEPPKDWLRSQEARNVSQSFRHAPEEYLKLIDTCQQQIDQGESYEICLTNEITVDLNIDPLNTYRALRERNPAPYASFLNFPQVSVLCSSPERFLTIDPAGEVEAKPIKGTRRRGATPEEDRSLIEDLQSSEKDRSENLMIVDLMRNDLGSVSYPGSVCVPKIFAVESYATVHQLVSTVRGRLKRDVSAVRCVQRAFPGGSMTGAPKKRTLEIIDRLEAGPRGVYSGAIGFFGLNGSTDLNIVIRTIVVGRDGVTIGVGGAIIALSNPEEELEEMILKSQALISALSESALDAPRISRTG